MCTSGATWLKYAGKVGEEADETPEEEEEKDEAEGQLARRSSSRGYH